MLRIIQGNKEYEFDFDGFKIFQTSNPTLLYKQIFINSNIFIDDKLVDKEDIIYLDELSKTDQFINLNKKSELLKEVIDLICDYPLINHANLDLVVETINNNLQLEILGSNEGDITKIINTFLEVNDLSFLDANKFEIILNKYLNSKKLFILNNLDWLDSRQIYKHLNEHNFLIITNNFCNYINNKSELETLVIFKNNLIYTEILDYEKLINYLEAKINTNINDKIFYNFLNQTEEYINCQIMFYITKIN